MRGLLIPPVLGSRAVAGTLTSCSTSSLVSEAPSESLPFWSLAVHPGAFVGTINPRIDLSLLSSPVLAQMIATCAVDPLVIHILAPLMTQLPSFCTRARVIIPDGFDP